MTHGLTGAGVVIPGEDEHEVAVRVAALEAKLVPDGDVLGVLLVRQIAIATIRAERAYRHETALTAERMRRAAEDYDDARQAQAEQILAGISLDPATARRRLIAAPEGIDVLVARLRALREKTEPQTFVAWDEAEGNELDLCLGCKPGEAPLSRVALLTRGVMYDHWVGLDPAEFAGLSTEDRLLWAMGAIRAIITAEIDHLEAHRATLDPTRPASGRTEAPERSLLDLGKDGLAIRRYASAAERTVTKMLRELRLIRFEAKLAEAPPAEAAEVLTAMVTQMPALRDVRDELASFRTPSQRPLKPAVESIQPDLKSSFVPITIGRPPVRPVPPAP